MNDILKTYMERFRENRHTLRRYTAFVLALAMITTLFVNWQLHGVGISMTAQYQCGEEEHIHTADCYTKVLTCGYEEGELENADEVAAAAATSQPTVEAEPAPLSRVCAPRAHRGLLHRGADPDLHGGRARPR